MAQKVLEKGSKYATLDIDGDGIAELRARIDALETKIAGLMQGATP